MWVSFGRWLLCFLSGGVCCEAVLGAGARPSVCGADYNRGESRSSLPWRAAWGYHMISGSLCSLAQTTKTVSLYEEVSTYFPSFFRRVARLLACSRPGAPSLWLRLDDCEIVVSWSVTPVAFGV